MRVTRLILVSLVACAEPVSVSSPAKLSSPRTLEEQPVPCNGCVLGPLLLENNPVKNAPLSVEFPAIQGEYQIAIDPGDQPGSILDLELNGESLPPVKSQKTPISGRILLDVRLLSKNILKWRFLGRPDGRFLLEIPAPPPPGACPAVTGFLPYATTPAAELLSIVPLGNLNPEEHAIPTHHVYMVPLNSGEPGRLPAYSPTAARVGAIGRDDDRGDYYLYLDICEGLQFYFIHLTELSPRLAWLVAEPFGGFHLGPGFFKLTSVDVAPNELLGYANTVYGPYDLGAADTRRPPLPFANPSRYTIPPDLLAGLPPDVPIALVNYVAPVRLIQFCAIDYFTPTVRAALEPLFGSFDGTRRRTAAPVCGEHMQDIPGTAQGNWFTETGRAFPESGRIALVHDNVDPTLPTFSISDEFAFWSVGDWRFTPAVTGMVNRDFPAVVPGSVYCYEGLHAGGSDAGTVLIEVFGVGGDLANRLRIERQGAVTSCGAGPWAFTAAAVVFQR